MRKKRPELERHRLVVDRGEDPHLAAEQLLEDLLQGTNVQPQDVVLIQDEAHFVSRVERQSVQAPVVPREMKRGPNG